MQNLYRILGVPKDADQETIKKAYKKLVRKYHPDVNSAPEAADRFQEVKKAYEVLGSPEDRKMYDHYGDLMFKEGFNGSKPSNDGWDHSSMGGFESFFRGFTGESSSHYEDQPYSWESRSSRSKKQSKSDFGFGNNYRRSKSDFEPPEKGTDIRISLKIGLLDAIRGCDKKITLRRPSRWRKQAGGLQQEIVSVTIPAGIQNGAEIKVGGKGNYGKGGGADGNLVVLVDVQPPSHLYREGADIYIYVPVTLKEALLGAEIQVPTLGKKVKVRVPKGVKIGQKLRLKGRGGVKATGGNGDIYLVLFPSAPVQDSSRLREIAEELEGFYPAEGIRHHLNFDP